MEKIVSLVSGPEIIQSITCTHDDEERMSGYAVQTNKQTISMLIDNEQNCCEDWGYMLSEDEPEIFVGATLHNVTLTDTALKTVELYHDCDNDTYNDTVFVNLETDRGTLQFVAYNIHNGYYGHKVQISSHQLTHEEVI